MIFENKINTMAADALAPLTMQSKWVLPFRKGGQKVYLNLYLQKTPHFLHPWMSYGVSMTIDHFIVEKWKWKYIL